MPLREASANLTEAAYHSESSHDDLTLFDPTLFDPTLFDNRLPDNAHCNRRIPARDQHFRADFTPIAEEILVAKAPGPMIADPSEFAWKRLAPGIRLKPNGRPF